MSETQSLSAVTCVKCCKISLKLVCGLCRACRTVTSVEEEREIIARRAALRARYDALCAKLMANREDTPLRKELLRKEQRLSKESGELLRKHAQFWARRRKESMDRIIEACHDLSGT